MNVGLVIFPLFQFRGGLERVGTEVAHAMLGRGHRVTVFYDAAKHNLPAPTYPVDSAIPLIGLELSHKTWFLNKARRQLRDANLDILVLFSSSTWLLWFPHLLKGTGIPLLVSEHSHPEHSNESWNPYERMACLELADTIHLLHKGYTPFYPEYLHAKINIIPNALSEAGKREPLPGTALRPKTILAAGRFDDAVKQFSLLIEAFALLPEDLSEWSLLLCGDGNSREDYEKLAEKYRLGSRLIMPGTVANMEPVYAQAGLMCVPSRLETLSTVTLEAYSHGLPVVSFADCQGQRMLVRHGETGLLAEHTTAAALAETLEKAMRDDSLRTRMGNNALEHSRRYTPAHVYPQWEDMIQATAEKKGNSCLSAACAGIHDCLTPQAKELLQREHPQDRRGYVHMHQQLRREGKASPFSDAEIAVFQKKHRRFGLSGPKRLLRTIGNTLLHHD